MKTPTVQSRRGRWLADTARQGAVVLLAILWIAPLAWMLSTSVKPEWEALSLPVRWVPKTLTLENYRTALTASYLLRWFLNSLWITGATVVAVLSVQALAAYAFARMRFPGRNALFLVVLATLMIPAQVILVPMYLLVSQLRLVNTYTAVILPPISWPFGVFLLKQFFEGIPRELEDAARIDGCGHLSIFLRIVLPLSVPALSALGIFTALTSWNDFLWPLVVLQDELKMTLPIGLSSLQASYATSSYGVLMAAACIASVPILLVYGAFQDRIVKGITLTGGLGG